MKIIMCSNAAGLQEALRGFNSATVEAEYGDTCVPGSVVTLAHHGPRRSKPSPCIGDNMPNGYLCEGGRYCAHGSDSAHWVDVEVVGVSHFDLDTLGGVLRVLGRKPNDPNFWAAAAAVPTNQHGEVRAHNKEINRLLARNYRAHSMLHSNLCSC